MKKFFLVLTVLTIVSMFLGVVFAAEMSREMFISTLYGSVMIKKSGAKDFVAAKKDMPLSISDEIKTGKDSYCEIAFDKELATMVSMKENSDLIINKASIDQATNKEDTLLDLQKGSVMTKVKKLTAQGSQFKIKTPTSIVGVRGTNFEVKVVE
ncbi:MAG: FecR family protein [Candidatus Omnitrophica bacterium]|nr:FecR family protein [Candidatus Omnitrophota bacterium]MDD5236491.1 FecR family protein [Candidatus Omnitrophota bacterium]MDD5610623.1 FecR family protein [Candidatus Omnitrophota bacterium]